MLWRDSFIHVRQIWGWVVEGVRLIHITRRVGYTLVRGFWQICIWIIMKFKNLVQISMFYVGSRLPAKPIVGGNYSSFKHKRHGIWILVQPRLTHAPSAYVTPVGTVFSKLRRKSNDFSWWSKCPRSWMESRSISNKVYFWITCSCGVDSWIPHRNLNL